MRYRMRYGVWTIIVTVVWLLLTGTATAAGKEFEGVTLTVNGFGGALDDVLKEVVAKPLKEKYGINVIYEPGTTMGAVSKLMAERGNPHLDVIQLDSPNMPQVIEAGIIDQVTEQELPGLRQIYPMLREFGNYGVPVLPGPIVLAYNTAHIKTPPVSLNDLSKPEYRGRVAIFNLENSGGVQILVALAESNGGGVNNIAPGFAKLREIKPNLVATPAANPALAQLFQQGEIWVAPYWLHRTLALQAGGFPIAAVVPKEGVYSQVTYANIVKGTRQRAAALKYLEQAISPEAEEGMASKFFFAPTNSTVKLPADLAAKVLLYGPENMAKAKTLDWAAVARNRGTWIEEWNKEMSK